MSTDPTAGTTRLCRSSYYTDTGRRQGHNDREVRCGLPEGHDGDHDEMIDGEPGNSWPRRSTKPEAAVHDYGSEPNAGPVARLAFGLRQRSWVPDGDVVDSALRLIDAKEALVGEMSRGLEQARAETDRVRNVYRDHNAKLREGVERLEAEISRRVAVAGPPHSTAEIAARLRALLQPAADTTQESADG
jgi:hypothetical protein